MEVSIFSFLFFFVFGFAKYSLNTRRHRSDTGRDAKNPLSFLSGLRTATSYSSILYPVDTNQSNPEMASSMATHNIVFNGPDRSIRLALNCAENIGVECAYHMYS